MPVRFAQSASKHGFTLEQALYAIEHAVGYVKEFTDPSRPPPSDRTCSSGPSACTTTD